MLVVPNQTRPDGEAPSIGGPLQNLRNLTDAILSAPYRYRDPMAEELLKMLGGFVEPLPSGVRENSDMPGLLSTFAAAKCVSDWARTYRYMQAIRDAVHDLEHTIVDRDIFFIDAGAGPLAFLSVMAALQSQRVRGIALEGNPLSVACASLVVERLGLQNQVHIVQTDARTFKSDRPIDLFLTETFDAGLFEEWGPEILRNFSEQLGPHGKSIPQSVTVEAAVRRRNGPLPMSNPYWRAVFTADCPRRHFESRPTTIAQNLRPAQYEVFVSTRIDFGGAIARLDRYANSPITQPIKIGECAIGARDDQVVLSLNPRMGSPSICVVGAGTQRYAAGSLRSKVHSGLEH